MSGNLRNKESLSWKNRMNKVGKLIICLHIIFNLVKIYFHPFMIVVNVSKRKIIIINKSTSIITKHIKRFKKFNKKYRINNNY
jgi:beta-N-acetylglucosaminidase